MKSDKSFLKRLFSHNLTLLIIAFVIAFATWFIVSANSQTDTSVTVSDIPITIELPKESVDEGLQVFSGGDVKASVEVTGNRITVGSLTPSDIQVVANQSNSIIAPGTYTLALSAKKTGVKTNYSIVSTVTPSNVTIYVDKLKEAAFDIENQLIYKVKDGYYANASLSETSVALSGPDSEVSQVDKVVVQGTVEGELTDSKTVEKTLIYLDKDGKELDLPLTTADTDSVKVAISVFPMMDVDLEVDVENAPKSYPKISISPSTIKIAGPADSLKDIKDNKINIGTVDFRKLKNEKTKLSFDISLPTECKNISNESTATVSVDLSKYHETSLSCKIGNELDSSKYSAEYDNTVDITVYGPKDDVSDISATDLTVTADFSDVLEKAGKEGSITADVPLKISLSSDFNKCWVYGDYTVTATVTAK